jgi:serine/tyrosine/threonine adenylyltransferase
LYDGHPAPEPGAVVCRVAPSFTRFGHFEILAARDDVALLRRLADFTIRREFPELAAPGATIDGDVYVAWYEEISRRTLAMIVEWMRVGFVHGVMNTDNMSILGLTIDYGPYGWLENYDPDWTPNTTDAGTRRYRFGQQPAIAQWNLLQLANAIYPLVGKAEPLEAALTEFARGYGEQWRAMMARKLGLRRFEAATDEALLTELDAVLKLAETDMTIFFRRLADVEPAAEDAALLAPLADAYYVPDQLTADVRSSTTQWLRRYLDRRGADGLPTAERRRAMNAINPKYVLRNYLAQLAIDKAEQGDFALVNELLDVLRAPYDEQSDREAFAQRRPDWARDRVGCSMLSCSS